MGKAVVVDGDEEEKEPMKVGMNVDGGEDIQRREAYGMNMSGHSPTAYNGLNDSVTNDMEQDRTVRSNNQGKDEGKLDKTQQNAGEDDGQFGDDAGGRSGGGINII